MVAFIAQTSIHVLRAIQMKLELPEFKEEKADIFLVNTFLGVDKIEKTLKKCGLFNDVYVLEQNDYQGRGVVYKYLYTNNWMKQLLSKNQYNFLVTFNLESPINTIFYNSLRKNKSFKYYCVEDGPGFYKIYWKTNWKKKIQASIFGVMNPPDNVDIWWFSCPNLMDVPTENAIKKQLPLLNRRDYKMVKIANEVFGFERDAEIEDADILIMEESYFNDGLLKNNDDFILYKKIKESFPNQNILVKLHPRTSINRFKNDFNCIEKSFIPWELFELNYDMRDKLFIAIMCTTLISPKILFDDENNVIQLFPIFKNKIISEGEIYINGDREKILLKEKELYEDQTKFTIIENEKELFATIEKYIACKETQNIKCLGAKDEF